MLNRKGHVFVTPICLVTLISCAKFVITERRPPEAPLPQRTSAADVIPSPTPERIIRLTVAQVEPESWWDSCMFLSVNGGAEVEIGCGKQKEQKGKIIELPAKKDFCNQIRIRMQVTTGCPKPQICETKSWTRQSNSPGDLIFFKFVEGVKMFPLDGEIQAEPEMKSATESAQKQAVDFTKNKGNTWIRIWFEDQTLENYQSWQKDKSKWFEAGIDYNDYAIDLKGENVDFTIAGSNLSCTGR